MPSLIGLDAPAFPRPRVRATGRRGSDPRPALIPRKVSRPRTPSPSLSPAARPAASSTRRSSCRSVRNTRFSSTGCTSHRVRRDGSPAPLSRGERSLGQDRQRPEFRQREGSRRRSRLQPGSPAKRGTAPSPRADSPGAKAGLSSEHRGADADAAKEQRLALCQRGVTELPIVTSALRDELRGTT